MYKNILIATDGSELSGKGIEAGLDLAKASGAKVTVLTVSEPFPAYDLGSAVGLFPTGRPSKATTHACRKLAADDPLERGEGRGRPGVACETLHVENSAPAKAILDTAKARSCDLIVLTSHGRHGLERFLLGSQASRVVQSAETSVLVVR